MCLQTSTRLRSQVSVKRTRGGKIKKTSEGRGSVGELLYLPTKLTPQHANSYVENIYNIKAKETCCTHENSVPVFSFAFIIVTPFLFAFLKKRRYSQFSIWRSTWSSQRSQSLLYSCMNFYFSLFIYQYFYFNFIFQQDIKLPRLCRLILMKIKLKYHTVSMLNLLTYNTQLGTFMIQSSIYFK